MAVFDRIEGWRQASGLLQTGWVTGAARLVLWLEPIWLGLMVALFWFPSPAANPASWLARERWLWMLAGIPVIWLARWLLAGRLWSLTPLDFPVIGFVFLCIIGVELAPRQTGIPTRGLMMLGRPLLGIALYQYVVDYARRRGDIRWPLQFSVLFALFGAVLALGATQWNSKSTELLPLINLLPQTRGFPGAEGGFNANEIAGALAWLTPLMAGLALHNWRRSPTSPIYWGAGVAFGLTFLALFLGHSRSALLGVLLSLGVLVGLLLPRRWWIVAGAVAGVVIVLQFLIITNLLGGGQRAGSTLRRDESSMAGRFDIWRSALDIMRDYPLTGIGMSMFRDGRIRARYPAPAYDQPILPHTHNEILQVATDAGVPGLALFIGWHVSLAYMAITAYRRGDRHIRAVVMAAAAGLGAHAVFGLSDTITLWDRFAFVYWWLIGLAAAPYIIMRQHETV
jgi:O-antigen ligase